MSDFAEKIIHTWQEYVDDIAQRTGSIWVYRGQSKSSWKLQSSLERSLDAFEIRPGDRIGVEKHMIRDFRRRYKGPDEELVRSDTLYCVALMQHYGAPTRLLDFTYSPFIAAFFALAKVTQGIVWMLNTEWIFKRRVPKALFNKRDHDGGRDDTTFLPLYMEDRCEFANLENPFVLNERLVVQQGAFLCPGSISVPFEQNVRSMEGWDDSAHVTKLVLDFDKTQCKAAYHSLMGMNISSASLFPGLDGYSRSLRERITLYEGLTQK